MQRSWRSKGYINTREANFHVVTINKFVFVQRHFCHKCMLSFFNSMNATLTIKFVMMHECACNRKRIFSMQRMTCACNQENVLGFVSQEICRLATGSINELSSFHTDFHCSVATIASSQSARSWTAPESCPYMRNVSACPAGNCTFVRLHARVLIWMCACFYLCAFVNTCCGICRGVILRWDTRRALVQRESQQEFLRCLRVCDMGTCTGMWAGAETGTKKTETHRVKEEQESARHAFSMEAERITLAFCDNTSLSQCTLRLQLACALKVSTSTQWCIHWSCRMSAYFLEHKVSVSLLDHSCIIVSC